jgi:hypothetical protein
MATRNQSDAIRQPLSGAWQQISGAFNFTYTSIAGFPRLLLHHDGSLYVLAGTGAILWLKPEYQINGGAWTDSGWGPDGGKFTFPAGWDATISLHCNRPCFPTAYPAGTVINTRVMAKCSGSVVLCDSLLDPYPDVSKTWVQADSYQWNEAEDDVDAPPVIEFSPYTLSHLPPFTYYDVEFANGIFMSLAKVGTESRSFTSADAIDWQYGALIPSSSLTDICFGNGIWIATSYSASTIYWSPDNGQTWTPQLLPQDWFPNTPALNAIAFGGSTFLGLFSAYTVPQIPQVYTSTDGVSWDYHELPAGEAQNWSAVAYGNGVFVGVASGFGNTRTLIYAGGSVSTVSNYTGRGWRDIAFGDGKFVAVSYGTTFMVSTDNGFTWTEFTVPSSREWDSVKYFNGKWTATAGDGTQDCIMESVDLVTWTTLQLPQITGSYLRAVSGNEDGLSVAVAIAGDGDQRAFASFNQADIATLVDQEEIEVSVGLDELSYYKFSADESITSVQIDLTDLTGDVDLYIGDGYIPYYQTYLAASENSGTISEQIIISNTADTNYGVCVYGGQAGSGKLKITLS